MIQDQSSLAIIGVNAIVVWGGKRIVVFMEMFVCQQKNDSNDEIYNVFGTFTYIF